MPECCQYGNGGEHACKQVGHRYTDLLRATTEIIAFACHAHKSTHALNGIVVASAIGIRTGLTKTCDAAINQSRIEFLQGFKVQPISLHVADLEVLNKNVKVRHHCTDQFLPFSLGEVAGD